MRLLPPILACLTLGLAPFVPEPHIVGKLRWVGGGAHGMALMDWLDLAFHGAPWLWLFWTAGAEGLRRARPEAVPGGGAAVAGVVAAVLGAAACVLYAWLSASGA